jgi:uncharacterized membrane protein (DUF2068 family)
MYMPRRRQRPVGVSIIAVIVGIVGIVGIISGILLFVFSPFAAIIGIIIGVVELLVAWGLWTLQPWAFWTTVVVQIIGLVEDLFTLSQGGSVILSLVLHAVILAYFLLDRNVRAAFRT